MRQRLIALARTRPARSDFPKRVRTTLVLSTRATALPTLIVAYKGAAICRGWRMGSYRLRRWILRAELRFSAG